MPLSIVDSDLERSDDSRALWAADILCSKEMTPEVAAELISLHVCRTDLLSLAEALEAWARRADITQAHVEALFENYERELIRYHARQTSGQELARYREAALAARRSDARHDNIVRLAHHFEHKGMYPDDAMNLALEELRH